MPTLVRVLATQSEGLEGKAVLTRLREAFVARLRGDHALVDMLAGDSDRIVRRPRLIPVQPRPLVTYFDFGTRPDATVPLEDMTWQVDIWGRDPDENERIAERVKALLHKKPLQVPGYVRGRYFQLVRNWDRVEEDGDLIQTGREFRLLAYGRT